MNNGEPPAGNQPSTGPGDPIPTDRGSAALSAPDIRTEAGFAAAVRQALRDFHRPNCLRNNPLLASR